MIQQLLKYRFHLWFIVALLQAAFTDIFHDEAYYWLWSKHLAWGYFDHPPMIAWIIRIGTLFGDQEIFVRLVVVLMNLVFIYLLEKLVAPKNLLLFWKIILSVFVLQIGGIIAVPDLPLMFFAMLFFFVLKQYLENDSILLASLLALFQPV
jgi:4-amino-4-deoxy-L-arabinose transferase-like glycosyltransferase